MTGYERALARLADTDRAVAARHDAERDTDPWFTEGYDLAHQQHLDAMAHTDVEPDTPEPAADGLDRPAEPYHDEQARERHQRWWDGGPDDDELEIDRVIDL